MNRREIERLLAAIRAVERSGERAALATVVRIRGSAYRREGTRIVVREDGSYECLLSGGCLEPAVAEAAARVIETGVPIVAQYDLEADSVWSLGIGCSGAVDIHIERLETDPVTRAWLDLLETAGSGVLVKPLKGADGRLLVQGKDVIGSLGDAALDAAVLDSARARLEARFPQSGCEAIGPAELFFEVSTPPPELVVFGAGFDVEPLVRQGWELGMAVTVVDPREAFLTAERFPHTTLVCTQFARFAADVAVSERSFLVIMNHHLERDRECLRFALSSQAPFIGLLGPRSRFGKLRGALLADGVPDDRAWARVRSPVGLAIGADSPEEIAVSILGEIVALQRGFDGGFLAGRDASLHRASENSALARS
jgi:xanthine/CO dehydrogenase XdhC/CoxF family maturation factor